MALFTAVLPGMAEKVDLAFTSIGNTGWSSSYAQHVVTGTGYKVTFSSASKQTGTVTTVPVMKNTDVVFEITDDNTLKDVKFNFVQWGTKTQSAKLSYLTKGASSYKDIQTSAVKVTTTLNISTGDLPANVTAIKLTTTEANQIGVSSIEYTLNSGGTEFIPVAPTSIVFTPSTGVDTNTKISLDADDAATRPVKLTYSIDNETYSENYSEPFTLSEGTHTVYAKAKNDAGETTAQMTYNVAKGAAVYTIVFKDNGSDSGTEFNNSTFLAYISEGKEYVQAMTSQSKSYPGTTGIKFGSSSATGNLSFSLSELGQKKATKVVINAMTYGSDASSIKFNNTTKSLTGAYADYEFALTDEIINSISLEITGKRGYVKSITVYYREDDDQPSEKLDAGLKFSESAVSTVLGEPFTKPTLTFDTDGTITYSSSDDAVASVDANTGDVTINKPGTATITATSTETDEYAVGSASYTITVGTGTITVAKALELIADGYEGDATVKGVITSITEMSNTASGSTYGNATYIISDEDVENALTVYRGYWKDGAKFETGDEIAVGGTVTVSGTLVNFNGNTPEFTTGSKVVEYTAPQGGGETPEPDPEEPTAGSYTITFDKVTSDDGNDITNADFMKFITEGAEYVASASDISKAYKGTTGLKLGSGKAVGKIVINLTEKGQVNVTKIVANARQYNTTACNLTINDVKVALNGTDLADYTFEFDGNKVESLTIETSGSDYRAYVQGLTIYYGTGTVTPEPELKDYTALDEVTEVSFELGESYTLPLGEEHPAISYAITPADAIDIDEDGNITAENAVENVAVKATWSADDVWTAGEASFTVTVTEPEIEEPGQMTDELTKATLQVSGNSYKMYGYTSSNGFEYRAKALSPSATATTIQINTNTTSTQNAYNAGVASIANPGNYVIDKIEVVRSTETNSNTGKLSLQIGNTPAVTAEVGTEKAEAFVMPMEDVVETLTREEAETNTTFVPTKEAKYFRLYTSASCIIESIKVYYREGAEAPVEGEVTIEPADDTLILEDNTTVEVNDPAATSITVRTYNVDGTYTDKPFDGTDADFVVTKMNRRFEVISNYASGNTNTEELFYNFGEEKTEVVGDGSKQYVQVTEADEIQAGDRIVIANVNNNNNVVAFMTTTANSGKGYYASSSDNAANTETVTLTSGQTTLESVPEGTMIIDVVAANGGFKLKFGDNYLQTPYTSGENFLLPSTEAQASVYTITKEDEYIKISSSSKFIKMNTGNKEFRSYPSTSGGVAEITVYKEKVNSTTVTTIEQVEIVYDVTLVPAPETTTPEPGVVPESLRTMAVAESGLEHNGTVDGTMTYTATPATLTGQFTFTIGVDGETMTLTAHRDNDRLLSGDDFHAFMNNSDDEAEAAAVCEEVHDPYVFIGNNGQSATEVTPINGIKLVNVDDQNAVAMSTHPNVYHDIIRIYQNPLVKLSVKPFDAITLDVDPTTGTTVGVDNIAVDGNNGATEYYNLQGMRVDARNLVPGVYITRQGNTTAKVLVR